MAVKAIAAGIKACDVITSHGVHEARAVQSSVELPFYEKTAKFASETVCGSFNIDGEWDKKLVNILFSQSASWTSARLIRKGDPTLYLHIELRGDRSIFQTSEPRESYAPLKDNAHTINDTWVFSQDSLISRPYDAERIETEIEEKKTMTPTDAAREKVDDLVIALFNSETFTSVETRHSVSNWSRIVNKIPKPTAKL